MVRSLLTSLYSANLHMTNLRTDEMVFFHNLTKIDTDENKAIYSNCFMTNRYRACLFQDSVP